MHKKMRAPVCGVLLVIAGCSGNLESLGDSATHWVRSDDFGEYRGLYVYTHGPGGNLYMTHYTEGSPEDAESQELCGSWQIEGDTLTWKMANGEKTQYEKNEKGVYVEVDGHYYVPVELEPAPVRDGKPYLE